MGSDHTAPINRLREALDLESGHGFLVTHLQDIRWATGFTGSNGCLLVMQDREVLVTDGRYGEQVSLECPDLEVHLGKGAAILHVGMLVRENDLAHLMVQKTRISWDEAATLQDSLAGKTRVSAADPMPLLRAAKTEGEVQLLRRILSVTETVFEGLLSELKEGVSEQDIAAEIDYQHRKRGASGPAFDTIVAFSDHAALPHARPGKRTLKRGDIILMDFGGVMDGYHSDMTRTISFGRTDKLFLEAYEAVRHALQDATEKAQAGITGEHLDGVARQALTMHGFGSAFAHSLGHGVGLEIHESPSVSSRNTLPLPLDSIITLEPGVYLPGEFGIRIENMVQLKKEGCVVLNRLDTELIRL